MRASPGRDRRHAGAPDKVSQHFKRSLFRVHEGGDSGCQRNQRLWHLGQLDLLNGDVASASGPSSPGAAVVQSRFRHARRLLGCLEDCRGSGRGGRPACHPQQGSMAPSTRRARRRLPSAGRASRRNGGRRGCATLRRALPDDRSTRCAQRGQQWQIDDALRHALSAQAELSRRLRTARSANHAAAARPVRCGARASAAADSGCRSRRAKPAGPAKQHRVDRRRLRNRWLGCRIAVRSDFAGEVRQSIPHQAVRTLADGIEWSCDDRRVRATRRSRSRDFSQNHAGSRSGRVAGLADVKRSMSVGSAPMQRSHHPRPHVGGAGACQS